ncbi:hypothetical protein UA08_05094 [Talaromyces atroroseus]|uniref:Extracellular membrane protein CFEM domain-containing protein n=1 Tax=Talaromyces atroroseus TaxID=1441469 RepID=A0A225AEB8_TALAT|nr:hypothetical protein UA08_05094 [Talaromyces atroroseus]OKL59602.1 hypothetical protein UA08_05094 [Talaromyces atroroseus]
MKFSIIALTGLVALAASEDATTTSLSPQASCATKCDPKDTCCNAVCYNVPCPDAAMANDTTACAAACPQGSGTPDDTAAYAKCQQSCYSSLFFGTGTGTATLPPATATATATDGSASASHTLLSGTVDSHGGSAQRTGSSSSDDLDSSPTSTATGSSTSASETGAASQIGIQLGVAGVLGAIMAAFFL